MELVRVFGHTFGSIASVILSVDFEFITELVLCWSFKNIFFVEKVSIFNELMIQFLILKSFSHLLKPPERINKFYVLVTRKPSDKKFIYRNVFV